LPICDGYEAIDLKIAVIDVRLSQSDAAKDAMTVASDNSRRARMRTGTL
jgi:hypothetical protein